MLQRAVLAAPNGLRGLRAKIYIRVSSTRGRKELISPELQEIAARAKAEQESIHVVDVVFDLDQSGRDFAKEFRRIAAMPLLQLSQAYRFSVPQHRRYGQIASEC